MPENIAVIRRLTEEAFIGGKIEVIDDVVAESFRDRDPMPGLSDGREGQKQICQMIVDGLTNRTMLQDEYLAVEDKVVQNWICQGTHSGEFLGVAATGKEIRIRGMEIWRLANGQVVERSGVVDTGDVFEQLGVLQPPTP